MHLGVACRLLGHDWEKRPVVSTVDPDAVIGVCDRCGEEAKVPDALAYGGKSVPGSFLEQDDTEKLRAMYRDGHIDEEKFEAGIAAALGDDSELQEMMADE